MPNLIVADRLEVFLYGSHANGRAINTKTQDALEHVGVKKSTRTSPH